MDKLADTISSYFKEKQGIIAVFLFGSYAADKQKPSSDIDVGLIIDPEIIPPDQYIQKRNHFLIELSRILRKDIHLVTLNTAGEGLLEQVLRKGKCISINDKKKLSLLRARMMLQITDFRYYKKKIQDGFIRNIIDLN